MKFCCDCQKFVKTPATGLAGDMGCVSAKCAHGNEVTHDLVYGYSFYKFELLDANNERRIRKDGCGLEAKNYVRKWWKFWRPR